MNIPATEVRAFYHVAAMGAWRGIVGEQLAVLARAEFPFPIEVGLIGAEADFTHVREAAIRHGLRVTLAALSDDLRDYEGLTLRALDRACRDGHRGAVVYFHTKGVSRPAGDPVATRWRRLMNAGVLAGWRECLARLEAGTETAGVNWLDCGNHFVFEGNFWWARADWIRSLPSFADYYARPPRSFDRANDPVLDRRFVCEEWLAANRARRPRAVSIFTTGAPLSERGWWDGPGRAFAAFTDEAGAVAPAASRFVPVPAPAAPGVVSGRSRGFWRRLAGGVIEALGLSRAGRFAVVSANLRHGRREACSSCPQRAGGWCRKAGGFVAVETRRVAARCPADRWER